MVLGFSAGAMEKLPETKATGKPDAKITSSWSTTWKVMQTIVERHCELAQNDSTIIQCRNTMHG